MMSVQLYGQKGQLDQESQTILFKIPFQPNLINKIEDQGELVNIQNVRKIQFKYFDRESILLYFQYEEIVEFTHLKKEQLQGLEHLLIMTIRSIFNLNKKQFKLLKIENEQILATNDGSIYFYHFEQNDNYDYTCERQMIVFLITQYLQNGNCQNEDNFEKLLIYDEYLDQITQLTSMTQMLNHKFFQWLFQQKISNKLISKTFYQDILQFYKQKEQQKINIKEQFIYRFPPQQSIPQKLEIETILFKIYILDAFQDKISKTFIGIDHYKLFKQVIQIKIKLMELILKNSEQSLSCLQLTIKTHQLKELKKLKEFQEEIEKNQSKKENVPITEEQLQEACIYFYKKKLQECFNQTKNLIYLFLMPYLSIIKNIDYNFIMCPIINKMQINGVQIMSLPYEQITYEEIGQLLTSNNEPVLRQFKKGGCFQKIPNQKAFIQ